MVTTEFEPAIAGGESYILCADCGTVISSANGAGLCMSALDDAHHLYHLLRADEKGRCGMPS